MTYARSSHRENGQAGAETLAVGVIVLTVLVLLFVTVWAAFDTKMKLTAAAREAAQTLIEEVAEENRSLHSGDQLKRRAESVVIESLGPVSALVEGTVKVEARNIRGGAAFDRCAPIEVVVTAEVRRIPLPLVQGWAGSSTIEGRHRAIVDPFRSGLSGDAICD